jgi:hypothetical protein
MLDKGSVDHIRELLEIASIPDTPEMREVLRNELDFANAVAEVVDDEAKSIPRGDYQDVVTHAKKLRSALGKLLEYRQHWLPSGLVEQAFLNRLEEIAAAAKIKACRD